MSETPEQAPRPIRPRTRRTGRLALLKRPDAANNARPKKVYPVHGGASKVLRDGVPDRRSALGKVFAAEAHALTQHVGNPTLPQARLIEQGARLHLLEAMAWAEVVGAGRLIGTDGAPHPAVDVLLRTMRERREVLRLLGLQRAPKQVPSLHDYLQNKQQESEDA